MTKSAPPSSGRVKKMFTKPSRTVRSQAYDCNINNMVAGKVPFTQTRRQPFYLDETVLPSNYEEQFNAVLAVQEAFMSLPPDTRQVFQNDPGRLIAALDDPSRQEQLRSLGILPPVKKVEVDPQAPNKEPKGKPDPSPGEQKPGGVG